MPQSLFNTDTILLKKNLYKNIGILTEKVETGVVNLKISYGGNVAAIRVTKDNLDHVGDDFYIVVLKLLEIA